ncbi:hypothetical protein CONLIGDRAFT_36295 [Coniochaeta ligniaria NRRL 30616]|uniref:Uncharacterized protein n=1 Tax=Coniochaeta ligniaria NRRL 30616 TaxID=1408157 RepID=A0A1J7J4G9_9PEZI|nr:hypothetical protein CONLIGDRAFT_36295 [Coniochaeta ligniaria NRRL 30616]
MDSIRLGVLKGQWRFIILARGVWVVSGISTLDYVLLSTYPTKYAWNALVVIAWCLRHSPMDVVCALHMLFNERHYLSQTLRVYPNNAY